MVLYASFYIHSLRIQAKNTLASVRMCMHSHGPSLMKLHYASISDAMTHTSEVARNA